MKTIWFLGDQLTHEHRALQEETPATARVFMVESKARGELLRYHRLKLVLVFSAMRHFAEELREAGWEVDYYRLEEGWRFETALAQHRERHGSTELVMAEPNALFETEAVRKVARRLKLPLRLLPTTQFLVSREEFRQWASGHTRLLMELHYRRVRKRFGWLMTESGEPVGGRWNFDPENRESFASWRRAGRPLGETSTPEEPDALTQEVMAMVAREFPGGPGRPEGMWLPVNRAGARRWLHRFMEERLPRFGQYEDMMAEGEPFLFHSVLSPLLNTGLLSPRECVEAAVEAYARGRAPLNSVEGYVRQIVGWREFINGVYWTREPAYRELNELGAERALPSWLYTGRTEMNCLHHVVSQTLALGWNHHIQRLMVLGNFFLVAGLRPQEALRWFLEMYVDAFDWVMPANVIGMSLYADGGYLATKPYAATSTYIRRMSNYCEGCRYDPAQKVGEKACPFNYLYWDFVDRHADRFAENPRMRALVEGWRKRPAGQKEAVRESARGFLEGEGMK